MGMFYSLYFGDNSPDLRFAGSPSLRRWRKEGCRILKPSLPLAEERVDKRSDVGVSNYSSKITPQR